MKTDAIDKKGGRKNRFLWTLRILLLIYAILYLLFIIDFVSNIKDFKSLDIENIVLIILFFIFIIGYSISWKNELTSGVIFIIWFLGMCFHNFFLCTSDCGAGIAMGIPLLILSILFIIYARRNPS
jgi:hypothetical protein